MTACGRSSAQVQLYVDGELLPSEQETFLSHLEKCTNCRHKLAEAEAFSLAVRRTRPYATASAELRECVQAAFAAARETEPIITDSIAAKAEIAGWSVRRGLLFRSPIWQGALAAMLLLGAGTSLWVAQHRRTSAANRFVGAALAANDRLESGHAVLDVNSNSPQIVSTYLSQKVTFPFRMPNDGIAADDRANYVLTGGSVSTFEGKPAALLAFKMSTEMVSILIAPQSAAGTIATNPTYSDGISFYSVNIGSKHVVTWKNKKLIYALVSTHPMQGKQSCSACHRTPEASVKTAWLH